MKMLKVERVKNHQHIVGQEVNEHYEVNTGTDVEILLGHRLERLDGETYDFYNDDIHAIYNLQNGSYTINEGDFTLYIEVSDAE